MARLFRIIDSSDPERELDGAGDCFGLWWVVSTWVCDFRRPSRIEPSRHFLIRFLHRPSVIVVLPYSVGAEDFPWRRAPDGVPQCGLECSHPALPDREITQVNQQEPDGARHCDPQFHCITHRNTVDSQVLAIWLP